MPFVVGVDYLPAVCHAPGVGRYARELVRAMVRLPACPELRLFEVGGGTRVMEGAPLGLEGAHVRRVRSRAPRRAVDWLHRLTGVGADRLLGGVDLFHRVRSSHPPVSRAAQVLPVVELPAPGTAADRDLARAVARAAGVIVLCEDYARRVAERYDVPPDRVYRVPVGSDHWRRELDGDPAPPPRPRILVLGALRASRHPAAVLAAFDLLRTGGLDVDLCFAGGPGDAAGPVEEHAAAGGPLTWTEPAEADMPSLVAGAGVLLHLSDEEGTAVTPLEAFSLGAAVVASRLPAFEEALGEHASYVETERALVEPRHLAEALAHELARVDDAAGREDRRARARTFTWEANARKTLEVWQHIHAQRGGSAP